MTTAEAAQLNHQDLSLMFADIVGYSRLMAEDEAQAIELLGEYRRILPALIEEHKGSVVDFIGDAIFARFNHPLDAVKCAIKIQNDLRVSNETRANKNQLLQTRIGIHRGNVAVRDQTLFGDAVNIAARIEPFAIPDGICVSEEVYQQVRNDLTLPTKNLGRQPFKNIDHEIHLFLLKPAGIFWHDHSYYFWLGVNRRIKTYRHPLLACLAMLVILGIYFIPRWLVPGYTANYVEVADFSNLNMQNGEADYFSAGIADAVRSQLADVRELYVVETKDKISAPIGLEGSVFRVDDNLRIEYRLFRRKNNVQIAGGKLDGRYGDIMILQDRLVGEIARSLAEEFSLQNFRPAPLSITSNVSAYDYYLKGKHFLSQSVSHENYDSAIQMFNTALVHDEDFSKALTGICEAYRGKYIITYDTNWINKASQVCMESLQLSPDDPKTLELSGLLLADKGELKEAIAVIEKARTIEPDSAYIVDSLAMLLLQDKRPEEAEKLHLSAISLAPENWEILNGYAYFLMNRSRYAEAIQYYNNILDLSPDSVSAFNNVGTAYFYLNNFQKSAQYLERAAALEPRADIYSNISTLFSYSGDMKSAILYGQEALLLEPNKLKFLVCMGQIYLHTPKKEKLAEEYFHRAIRVGENEIENAPGKVQIYQYLAIAYSYIGETEKARSVINIADQLGPDSLESRYTKLLISISEKDNNAMLDNANKLIAFGYSKELLLSDPNLKILHSEHYLAEIIYTHN